MTEPTEQDVRLAMIPKEQTQARDAIVEIDEQVEKLTERRAILAAEVMALQDEELQILRSMADASDG